MDPVTTAILSAAAAGAAGEAAKAAIGDAYQGLKGLLVSRFANKSEAKAAVAMLEKMPESKDVQTLVAREITESGADRDPELIALAGTLMARLQELPEGERQHIQQAIGQNIAQADRGSTAKVVIGRGGR